MSTTLNIVVVQLLYMDFIKKIVELLKKIGVLKTTATAGTYKGTKDKPYQIDVDPLEDN